MTRRQGDERSEPEASEARGSGTGGRSPTDRGTISDSTTPGDPPLFPRLGAGVGLRPKHYGAALAEGAALPDWFEVVTENFFVDGGRPMEVLREAAKRRPIVLHGVSLSIGGEDPLDERYLDRLAALVERVRPAMVSDHLCWGTHGGRSSHDLLPLVMTEAEAERIAKRVRHVQARIGRRVLLENVSSYLAWRASTMTEWAFLARVAEEADCGILLDVNNVFVNAVNHGFDAEAYLEGLPGARVGQIHLAGHADRGTWLFDTHDAAVAEAVWELYRKALRRFGPVSTLIERDDRIPEWEELLAEAARAREMLAGVAGTARRVQLAMEPGSGSGSGSGSRSDSGTGAGAGTGTGTGEGAGARTGTGTQGWLWRAITRGVDDAEEYVEGGALTPGERVKVYAEAYFARLHDALLADFPATDLALGHARFHALANAYARRNPSDSPTLRDFGRRFPGFLRGEADSSGWVAELAALEWARVEAFDAADAEPVKAEALAGLAPEKWPALTFAPHPSLRVVEARHRVDLAWKQADAGSPPDQPDAAAGALRVWREGTTVYHAWMAPPEAAALRTLLGGGALSEAASALASASSSPDAEAAAATLAAHLRNWLADRLFRR